MSVPQSSASDLSWAPMPREIRPDEAATAARMAERNATDDRERDMFLSMLGCGDR